MKPKLLKVIFLVLIIGVIAVAVVAFGSKRRSENRFIQIVLGDAQISAEVADNELSQVQGLSNRKQLPENQGMLFVFDKPDTYKFWMKDMQFPLDFIWINADKHVSSLSENIKPETYPETFGPAFPVLYVIEANSGFVNKHGIKVGDKVDF